MKIKSLVITAVLTTIVLFLSGIVFAKGNTYYQEVKDKIDAIRNDVHVLLFNPKPDQPAWCNDFDVNLSEESQGEDVFALQIALFKEKAGVNFEYEEIFKSYWFGEFHFTPAVKAAVIQFQEKYASEILYPYSLSNGNGFVGLSTRAKLNQLYGCNQPSITVTSPNGGETWKVGETHNITWNSTGLGSQNIDISLIGGPSQNISIANVIPASVGVYSWTIPVDSYNVGSNFKIFVSNDNPNTPPNASDDSDNYFTISSTTIQPPLITVTFPNGGEKLYAGSTYTFSWNTNNLFSTDRIFVYLNNGGASNYQICGILAGNAASCSDTVPALLGSLPNTQFKLFVMAQRQISGAWTEMARDYSDNYLTVLPAASTQPTITVTWPNGGETFTQGTTISGSFTTNLSAGTQFEVSLVASQTSSSQAYDQIVYNGTITSANSQRFSFVIPSNALSGDIYRVRVDSTAGGTIVQDQSDSNFSIAEAVQQIRCNSAQQCVAGGTGSICSTDSDCVSAPTTQQAIAHYPFDADAKDASGNGYNGIVRNGAVLADGKYNKAYQFDGINDYIAIAGPNKNIGLALGNEITLSAWIKTSSTALGGIIKRGNNSAYVQNQEYALYINGGKIFLAFGDTVNYTRIEGGIVNDNVWHLVNGVLKSDNTMEIYVDGILTATGTRASGKHNIYSVQLIGSLKVNSWFFRGLIDDARIYNYALTVSAIRQLYRSPDGNLGLNISPAAQPTESLLASMSDAIARITKQIQELLSR